VYRRYTIRMEKIGGMLRFEIILQAKCDEALAGLKAKAPPKLLNDVHSYTADSNYFRFEY